MVAWRTWRPLPGGSWLVGEQLAGDPHEAVDLFRGLAVEGPADVELDVGGEGVALPGRAVRIGRHRRGRRWGHRSRRRRGRRGRNGRRGAGYEPPDVVDGGVGRRRGDGRFGERQELVVAELLQPPADL